MVDLDSNPTKLIEIVEIGKQILMTRGALTTFSISNDVAKYFAILPAAFAGTYRSEEIDASRDAVAPSSAFWLRYQSLPAVRQQAFITLDANQLYRATPRILDAAEQLCRQLQPYRKRA